MECQNSGGCQQTENCPHIELAADRAEAMHRVTPEHLWMLDPAARFQFQQ